MDTIGFASLLRRIRNNYGYTQEEAAEGICSVRNYKRIENDDISPSAVVLNGLSKKFNYDFVSLYNAFSVAGSDVYAWKVEVSSAITKKDVPAMKKALLRGDALEQSKTVTTTKHYLKFIILHNSNASTEELKSECLKGLQCDNENFSFAHIEIKSNEGLCLLHSYAFCLVKEENYKEAEPIYDYLLNRIYLLTDTKGNFFESSSFILSFLPKCTVGYANLLILEKKYDIALEVTNKAIDYLASVHNIKYLHYLLWEKCDLLYRLDLIDESKEVFKQFVFICDLNKDERYKNKSIKVLEKWGRHELLT